MNNTHNEILDRTNNYDDLIDYSKWNSMNIHLYNAIKRFRRSNKFKDFECIKNLITYSENFKDHDFYEDLSKKYGLYNIMGKYILKTLKAQRKNVIPLDFKSVCNHRTYNGKIVKELCDIHVGFDLMLDLGETDHPATDKGVEDVLKMLSTWRSYFPGM